MAKNQPNIIPAEDLGAVELWALPLMDSNSPRVTSAEKERLERERLEKERADELVEDIEIDGEWPAAAMTAEQLQEIADAAEKEGYDEGHKKGLEAGNAEGYRAGQQKGAQEMKATLSAQQKRFSQLADTLFDPLNDQDTALEQALLSTVMTLATSIVKRELYADSSHVLSLVQEAIAALPAGASNLTLTLNPDDVDLIEKYAQENNTPPKRWQLVADADMIPGGCRVESAQSFVDYSVEKRLEQIIKQYAGKQLGSGDTSSVSHEEPQQGLGE